MFCPFWFLDELRSRCPKPALLFNIKTWDRTDCAGFCRGSAFVCTKKNADRSVCETQACPRKEGVRNSRCLCGAGKVEPHGLFTLHGANFAANRSLPASDFPAGNCSFSEKARSFAPTKQRCCGDVEAYLPAIPVKQAIAPVCDPV